MIELLFTIFDELYAFVCWSDFIYEFLNYPFKLGHHSVVTSKFGTKGWYTVDEAIFPIN